MYFDNNFIIYWFNNTINFLIYYYLLRACLCIGFAVEIVSDWRPDLNLLTALDSESLSDLDFTDPRDRKTLDLSLSAQPESISTMDMVSQVRTRARNARDVKWKRSPSHLTTCQIPPNKPACWALDLHDIQVVIVWRDFHVLVSSVSDLNNYI